MALAVTPGEPAGIGPDLLVALAQEHREQPWVVVGSAATLEQRAATLGLPLTLAPFDAQIAGDAAVCATPGRLSVVDIPLPEVATPGALNVRNARATLAALDQAVSGVLEGQFDGLVTGPMQKSIINDAGIPFTGHTEFLCEKSGVEDVVMLLVAGQLRVALATTHLPLRDVPDALTVELLVRRTRILAADLKHYFGLDQPVIALTGLNPHAGEGGHLGHEEATVIEPACALLRAEGIEVQGPFPADTLLTPDRLAPVDAVLAMYHDQGLPVLKYAGFGAAVNVTLGLPFVRTSVDHGTALDLAGSGEANSGSMSAALDLAAELVQSASRRPSEAYRAGA